MRAWLLVIMLLLSAPALAQDVAPVRPAVSSFAAAAALPADSNVAPFYAGRPGTMVWLRDAPSRAAAARLVDILKRAPVDGLADGPLLASSVEAALARGTPADDQQISRAWVRIVQALSAPVGGIGFGDPALQLLTLLTPPPEPTLQLVRILGVIQQQLLELSRIPLRDTRAARDQGRQPATERLVDAQPIRLVARR